MKETKLTGNGQSEARLGVQGRHETTRRVIGKAAMGLFAAAGLGGCINVAAPDEPIVIELNINIRQEVIYRLAEDAANTIDENADIF
ncbi:YnbE family lipoprotein [Erythrobacter insulae]|nr:YnbE family lipoprotein [Erythrobacter insulae]